jgi:large subunit ribosomal protein L29
MKNEFSSLTDKELAEKFASLKSELFNLRFTHSTGSLSNNSSIAVCKRNIARVKTIMRQRELGLAKAPEKEVTKKSTKKAAKVDAEVKG